MPARTCRACSAASSVKGKRNPGTVPYRWSNLPTQREWMLAHAGGRPIAEVCEDFEREFGTPISRTQVSLFRAEYGMQRRRGNRTAHNKRTVPIGTEVEMKGYIKVKVRDLPDSPQTKDNWMMKQRWVWERAHGEPVPPGHVVMFADGDKRNFDPANLVAVPRSCMGPLNNSGIDWHDADTLMAAVSVVKLKMGISDVLNRPRRCAVCGREFTPDYVPSSGEYTQRTCRDCLDSGLRAPKYYRNERTVTCPVCGAAFKTRHPTKKYCCKKCCNKAMYRNHKERNGK